MSRDLLKEAIADAKAVKETAIANAKAYLEEAFTPQLRSMLAAKLEEMDEDEVSETVSETEEIDEKKYADDDRKDGGESKETKRTEKMKYGKDLAEEEELDLDEILNSLEEEDNSEITEEDDSLEAAVGKTERDDYEKGKEAGEEEEGDKEEDMELDIEDMTEDDLKSFIETVIADMVEAGELEAGEEMEMDDMDMDDEEIEVEDEVEVEIAEATFQEGEDQEEDYVGDDERYEYEKGKEAEKKKLSEKGQGYDDREDESIGMRLGKESGKKQSYKARRDDSYGKFGKRDKEDRDGQKINKESIELNEAYDTIRTLKSELNEINLLNAKLLYTNKIFRNKALTEAQKVKILNAFDKATSVKEVKIVFETLNENIKVKTKSAIKENLGYASKATGAAPKTAAKPTVEVDPMVARFKKLAGLS